MGEQAADAAAVVEAPSVEAPAVVEAPAAKAMKKTKVKDKDNSAGNPKYKDMVMDAIITQKERSGSSLGAIKNHLGSKYKVDVAKKAGILNSVLKKMREEGVLVAGAPPGRKGAGCFKVSSEEKSRMADAAKAAVKKLKAQQKQGLGKVASKAPKKAPQKQGLGKVASKAPKKVAKASAGKKVAKGASAGKKMSAEKTALGSKKPAPKSNKAGGKKMANPSAKKPAPKTNKGKTGKALK